MGEELQKLLSEKKYTLNKLSKELKINKKRLKEKLQGLKGVKREKIAGQVYYSLKKEEKKKETNEYLEFLKKHYAVILVIAFTVGVMGYNLLRNETVWWDEAEYLVFAKNMATGSNLSGFWEGRAILYPITLGLFSFVSTNEVFLRVMNVLFGVLAVVFTYYSFKNMFNNRTALIATILFSSNWVFQFYAVRFLTDVPALMFQMLSLYYFTKKGGKNKIISGSLLGLATITRFTSVFIAPAYLLINIAYKDEKEDYYWIPAILIGFIPSVIYDLVNAQVPFTGLYSFFMQNVVRESSGESILAGDWTYYIININNYLNPALALLLAASLLLLVVESFKDISKWKLLIMVYFIICFVMFSFVSTLKELRFLMQFYPFMYLFITLLFDKVMNHFKDERVQITAIVIFSLIGLYSVFASLGYLNDFMEFKKDLGITVKQAGEYVQTITSPDELIVANYPPVTSYYTNRGVLSSGNTLQELEETLDEYNASYILLYQGDSMPGFLTNLPYPYQTIKQFSIPGKPTTYLITKAS